MKRHILIFLLVSSLLAACGGTATPTAADFNALEHAQVTLIDFFFLVHNGEYAEAAERHAENADLYEWLQQNNPDVDPSDRAALLEAGCTFQMVCMEIKEVVSAEQISETEFVFQVQFANEDDTTFILGPCCGEDETSMPPTSEFEYQVDKVDSEFLVVGWPVYVP